MGYVPLPRHLLNRNTPNNRNEAEIHYYDNGLIKFYTGDYYSSSHFEHLRITETGSVGIHTQTPSNVVEINEGNADYSGLTFTQLTSVSATNILPSYGKVLTVNGSGDVVLTDDGGYNAVNAADNGLTINPSNIQNVQLGSILGSGAGKLIHDSEIPMNDFNLIFSDPASIDGNMNSIGLGTLSTMAKLHVSRNLSTIRVNAPTAVRVENTDIDIPWPLVGTSVGISNYF